MQDIQAKQALSALSAADQARVAALFKDQAPAGTLAPVADGFRYRITRGIDGRDQTIEVPEAAVPSAIKA